MRATPPPEVEDEFFEVLAGRMQGLAGAAAMREALEAEAKTLHEAENACSEDLSADERETMAEIKQRLLLSGLLPTTPPLLAHGATSPTTPPSSRLQPAAHWTRLLSHLHKWLFDGNTLRLVAITASLVLVSLVIVQVAIPTRPPSEDVMRGEPVLVITVTDPASEIAELEQKLKAAGAEVIQAQINATEWALEVNVEKPERLDQVRKILSEAGYLIGKQPPYQLEVRKK